MMYIRRLVKTSSPHAGGALIQLIRIRSCEEVVVPGLEPRIS